MQIFTCWVEIPAQMSDIQEKPSQLPPGLGLACGWGPSLVTSFSCSRAGRGHLIVEPVCWQEALPRPAGSQHDNETVSMEMSFITIHFLPVPDPSTKRFSKMTPIFLPPTSPHTIARPANQLEEKGKRKCRSLTRCGKPPRFVLGVAVTRKQSTLAGSRGQVSSKLFRTHRASVFLCVFSGKI